MSNPKTSIWLLSFGLISALFVRADLDPALDLTQYIVQSWDTHSGLPQNSVSSIAQTPNGMLWFGTQEGLVRFDGFVMDVFNRQNTSALTSSSVNYIATDRSGRLWVATEDGGLLTWRDGEFATQTHRLPDGEHQIFYLFEASSGVMWLGTYGSGLLGLSPSGTIALGPSEGLPKTIIWAMAEQPAGCLWIGTEDGLFSFQDGKLRTYTKEDGLLTSQIWSLAARSDGSLWIGTSRGINIFRDGQIGTFDGNDRLPTRRILTFREDALDTLWLGLQGGGLARISGESIDTFSTEEGLGNPDVVSLFQDQEHCIWVGTDGGGLCRFRQGTMTPFTERQGLPNNMVRAMTADPDGTLWIATDGGGLARFHAGKFDVLDSRHGLSDDRLKSLRRNSRGGLWVGTFGGGVNYLHLGQFTSYGTDDGLPTNNVGTMCEDQDGNLWIASALGLIRFDRQSFRRFTTRDGLSSNLISNIFEDRSGTLWIGTRGGGLNYLKNGQFGVYTTDDGLSSNLILALYEDDQGNLWIGTSDHGLNLFRDHRFTCYTKRDGLFDDKILAIVPDDSGRFWISSNKGIFTVRIADLLAYDPAAGNQISCRIFGVSDGMKSAECNGGTFPSATKTPDGRLWFPTIHGIVSIHPEEIAEQPPPPRVSIRSILVDGIPRDPSVPLTLKPGTKKIEIRYSAVCFSYPDRIRFQYRLDGVHRDWIDAGRRRAAFFTHLKPGSYAFRVRASKDDGVWHDVKPCLLFRQKAYFFQQTWFQFLVALFGVLLGITLHRLQIRRIEKRREQLEEEVARRTQTLEDINHQLRTTQEQVVEAARRGGMAEIASNVLGQVEGYVQRIQQQAAALNDLMDDIHGPEAVRRMLELLEDHRAALETFLDHDAQGRTVRRDLVDTICAFPDHGRRIGKMIADVRRDVTQLTEIITAQQKYAKLEGTIDQVDINLLIVDAVKFCKPMLRELDITVSRDLKPIPLFEGQKSNLLKVLVSLIHRACQRISADSGTKSREVHMTSRRSNTQVVVIVHDTASGTPMDAVSSSPDDVKSGPEERHRLSLQTCRSLIEDMGGRLRVEEGNSKPGATVYLDIPFQERRSDNE